MRDRQRTTLRRLHTFVGYVGLLAMVVIASSSRARAQGADLASIYSVTHRQTVVFSVGLQSPVTIDVAPDPYDDGDDTPVQVARAVLQDVRNLAVGQRGQFVLDGVSFNCAVVDGWIFEIDAQTNTVTLGWANPCDVLTPEPESSLDVAGLRFESILFSPTKGSADNQGNVYVADTGNNRIAVFDRHGAPLRSIGSFGTPLLFEVGIDQNGDPTITPINDPSLWPVGTCFDVWWNVLADKSSCPGSPYDKAGYFWTPTDVAVNDDGTVLVVSDSYNSRVQVLTRDDQNGTLAASDGVAKYTVRTMGVYDGLVQESFVTPWAVDFDESTGRIVVADIDADRIQVLDPDANGPVVLSGSNAQNSSNYRVQILGGTGEADGPGELDSPSDVAIDPTTGHVAVSDTYNSRVQIFDPANPQAPVVLAGPSTNCAAGVPDGSPTGSLTPEFCTPWGLDIDSQGRLLVADTGNQRLQLFEPDGNGGYTWRAQYGATNGLLFTTPEGVAIANFGADLAAEHQVFVVDNQGHSVHLLLPAMLKVISASANPTTVVAATPADDPDEQSTVHVVVENIGAIEATGVTALLAPSAAYAGCLTQIPGPSATIAPGDTHDFAITITCSTVTTDAIGPLVLTTTASGLIGGAPVTTSALVTDTITVTPAPVPAATVSLTAPALVATGSSFTAHVNVGNSGAGALNNVQVTLTATPPGAANIIPPLNLGQLGVLNEGAQAPVVDFAVTALVSGPVVLTATVTTNEVSPAPVTSVVSAVPDASGPTTSAAMQGTPGRQDAEGHQWYWAPSPPPPAGIPAPPARPPLDTAVPPTVTITADDLSGVAELWYWMDSTNIAPYPTRANIVPGPHVEYTIPGELPTGPHKIAFWTKDMNGFWSARPIGWVAGAQTFPESIEAFCTRTGQCLETYIDNIFPKLIEDRNPRLEVNLLANPPEVRVHFATSDDQSQIWRVCLKPATPQEDPDACLINDELAHIEFDQGSLTNGWLVLQSPNAQPVFGTVLVTDESGLTNEFSLPFATDYRWDLRNETYHAHGQLTVGTACGGAKPGILCNDTNVFGNAIAGLNAVLSPNTGPFRGSLGPGLAHDGSFTYTPLCENIGGRCLIRDTGAAAGDLFFYKLADPNLDPQNNIVSDSAKVDIIIDNVIPTAGADLRPQIGKANQLLGPASTVVQVPINVLMSNDSDPESDPLTFILESQPVLEVGGVPSPISAGAVAVVGNDVVFTSTVNFAGVAIFKYRLLDGYESSAASPSTARNIGIVKIPITDQAPAPSAVPKAYVTHNQPVAQPVGALLVGATDADDTFASLTVRKETDTTRGTSVVNTNGQFTYTPAPGGYVGDDVFTFTVLDQNGRDGIVVNGQPQGVSAPATVTITIVNDIPSAVADAYLASRVLPLTVSAVNGVLKNDTDAEDDSPLTVQLVTPPQHALAFTLNPDGSFLYQHNVLDLLPHTTDTFQYRVLDGYTNSAATSAPASNVTTVTITFNAIPAANNDTYSAVKNTTLTRNAAAGVIQNPAGKDVDADHGPLPLTASLVSGTSNGSLTLNADGRGGFSYTPQADFVGTDTFTYKVNDGQDDSNIATVTIHVTDVPPPSLCMIVDFREITYFRNSQVLTSTDAGIRTRNGLTGPFNPALWPYQAGASTSSTTRTPSRGTLFRVYGFKPDQLGVLVPNADNASVAYPVLFDATIEGGAYYIDLGGPARVSICPEQLHTYALDSLTPPGAVEGTTMLPAPQRNVPGIMLSHNTQIVDLPDRTESEMDALGLAHTDRGLIDYVAFQQQGYGSAAFREFVDVQISFPRDSETDRLQHFAEGFHTAMNYNLEGSVSCEYLDYNPGDDTMRLRDLWGANRRSVSGYLPWQACGSREPAANQRQRENYDVPFNAAQLLTAVNTHADTTRLFYGEIRPVAENRPPVAVNDTYTVAKNQTLTVPAPGVLGNDSDPDGDVLTAVRLSNPSSGALSFNANGSFTYAPASNFTGTVSFLYVAKDPDGRYDLAVVSITVVTTNTPPAAGNNSYSTPKNIPLTVAAPGVLGNDSDADGDALTAVLVSGPSSGTLALNPNGGFVYSPASGFTGTATFTYKAKDSTGAFSNVATVSILVSANQPPDANDDSYAATKNTALTVSAPGLLANDTDPDGAASSLLAYVVSAPTSGTVTINTNGSFTYTPANNFTGTATFTYRVKDASGAYSSPATVTITVSQGAFTTFTQGGWGANPSGNNPAKKLQDNWSRVYGSIGYAKIGVPSTNWAKFTSSGAVQNFLPAGGTANKLTTDYTNPTSTSAGVFAGQVLALKLNVDFSNAGITRPGLGNLRVVSGKLAGYTVNQVMALANTVIGGTISALPSGVSLSNLNDVVDKINNNFVDGTQNNGYLQ